MHFFAVLGIVNRALHQVIQSLAGHLCRLPAGEHAGNLRQRRNGPGRQNRGAHQRTGGHVAADNQITPHQQHHGVDDRLHLLGPGQQQPRQPALLHADARGNVIGVIPLVLKPLLGAHQLDVLKPLHRFHQRGVTNCRFTHPFAGEFSQRALHQQAGNEQQRYGQQHDQHQRAANHPQNEDEQQEERQIGDSGNGGGSDQLPHRLQLADLGDKRPGRFRPCAVFDPQGVGKHALGNTQVGAFPYHVRNMHPQHAHDEFKHDGDHHAAKQHPQRGLRLGRHHPVVHLHGKDHAGERQHVGDQRHQHYVTVTTPVFQRQLPEPVFLIGFDVIIHARIRRGLQGTQHHQPL